MVWAYTYFVDYANVGYLLSLENERLFDSNTKLAVSRIAKGEEIAFVIEYDCVIFTACYHPDELAFHVF